MSKYYNITRGPLPLTLRNGVSLPVPGKSWIDIPAVDAGSRSVVEAIRKGYLVPAKVQPSIEPEPAPVVVPPPVVEPPPVEVKEEIPSDHQEESDHHE